jgi:hypothetical protein
MHRLYRSRIISPECGSLPAVVIAVRGNIVMARRLDILFAIMASATALSACGSHVPPPAAAPRTQFSEPANVGDAKIAATSYHDSGVYDRNLAAAAAPAQAWLTEVARPANAIRLRLWLADRC